MKIIRVYYKCLGRHYHCRFFSRVGIGPSFGKNGELTFDEQEWPEVKLLLESIADVKEKEL